jgi:murein tripeptide amidase MpaA
MNGLLNMLLDNNNPNSEIARENFVWVLVPQINPDGVYRGHYRTDAWC